MAPFALRLLAAASLALLCQAQQLYLVSVPDGVKMNPHAGALRVTDVPNAGANLLGVLPTGQNVQWGGVSAVNVLRRPTAHVTVLVNGLSSLDELKAELAFPIQNIPLNIPSAIRSLLSGDSTASTSLPSLVSSTFGDKSTVLAMSFDAQLAQAVAGARASHVIAASTGAFVDAATGAAISIPALEELLAANLLGADATYDAASQTLRLGDATIDLSVAETRALVHELLAMVHVASALPASPSAPSVATFAVSQLQPMLRATDSAATASLLIARAIAAIAARVRATHGQRALVQAVAMHVQETGDGVPMARMRRDPSGTVTNNSINPLSQQPNTIDRCAEYTCYCWATADGTPYDPATGCEPGCVDPGSKKCRCVWNSCDCASAYVQPRNRKCKTCDNGYVLSSGYCYFDSLWPVTFNIVLWVGIFIFIAIGITWYMLHALAPYQPGAIDFGASRPHAD